MFTGPLDLLVIIRLSKLKLAYLKFLGKSACKVTVGGYCKVMRNNISVIINRISCFIVAYVISYVESTKFYRCNSLSLLFSVVGKRCTKKYCRTFNVHRKNLERRECCAFEVTCTDYGKSINLGIAVFIYYVSCLVTVIDYFVGCCKIAKLYRFNGLGLLGAIIGERCTKVYCCTFNASLCYLIRFSYSTCKVTCTGYGKGIGNSIAVCINCIGGFISAYGIGYVELTKFYGCNCQSLLFSVVGKRCTTMYCCAGDAHRKNLERLGCSAFEVTCTGYGNGISLGIAVFIYYVGCLVTLYVISIIGYHKVAKLYRFNGLGLLFSVIGERCTKSYNCARNVSTIDNYINFYSCVFVVIIRIAVRVRNLILAGISYIVYISINVSSCTKRLVCYCRSNRYAVDCDSRSSYSNVIIVLSDIRCVTTNCRICLFDRECLSRERSIPVVAFATNYSSANNVVACCSRNGGCVRGFGSDRKLILVDNYAIVKLLVCVGCVIILIIFAVDPAINGEICNLFIYASNIIG